MLVGKSKSHPKEKATVPGWCGGMLLQGGSRTCGEKGKWLQMEEPQGSTEDTDTITEAYAVPPQDSKAAEGGNLFFFLINHCNSLGTAHVPLQAAQQEQLLGH